MNISAADLANKKKLAIAHFQSSALSDARALCTEICAHDESDPNIWCLLACIHGRTGKYSDAVTCARKSVEIHPDYDAAWVVLGNALFALKQVDEAITAYERALELNPKSVDALCGRCKVFETQHDLTKASNAIKQALQIQPAHAEANLYASILERRTGDLEASRVRLVRLLDDQSPESRSSRAYNELGKVLEHLGEYDDAYSAYVTGNKIDASAYEHSSADKGRIHIWISRHRDVMRRDGRLNLEANAVNDGLPTPAFLVGFPRSGTTLAEQILSSHRNVRVSNEAPILKDTIKDMSGSLGPQTGYPYDLEQMDPSEIRRLRAHYWELADRIPGVKDENSLFVDKLPLNIIFIPAIYRLFPGARILFAFRDPRDVCVSCFTNLFSANDAMANFTDMADTAKFYAATMDLWQIYKHKLTLNVLELRYEMLVSNFEETVRNMIAFLGLDWNDNVLDYYMAKNRRNVTTPSYQGIASPVHNRAMGRWRHFEEQLQPSLNILEPYVRSLGYGGHNPTA